MSKRTNGRPKVSKWVTHDELGGHLLLAKWHPTLRWHEPDLGFCVELGNHHSNAKGEAQEGITLESLSTDVEEWGRAVSISEEASVMVAERRGRILSRGRRVETGTAETQNTGGIHDFHKATKALCGNHEGYGMESVQGS